MGGGLLEERATTKFPEAPRHRALHPRIGLALDVAESESTHPRFTMMTTAGDTVTNTDCTKIRTADPLSFAPEISLRVPV